MKKLILLMVVLVLSACGGKTLDGTYASNWNGRSITFQSDGTLYQKSEETGKLIGPRYKYSIEGSEIKVPGTAFQLKLLDDGSIDGGAMYGRMVKK